MSDRDVHRVFGVNVLRFAGERTLASVGDEAGLSPNHIYDIVNGRKSPTLGTVACVAAALGVEPWRLLKEER